MSDFSVATVAHATNEKLFQRRCQLVVSDDTGQGYDLSSLRVQFRVTSRTVQTAKSAEITVLNVAPATLQKIFTKQEFTRIDLKAGYQNGPFSSIFTGQIAYMQIGKLDAITSFLKILATDSDDAYNWATINVTLKEGSTARQQLDAVLAVLKPYGIVEGETPTLPDTELPRPKALNGMVRDVLRDLARTVGCEWNFHDGKLNFISREPSTTGEVIVLTPKTGLVGAPEQTIDGLSVRALLNPNIVTGRLIQVKHSLVNQSAYGKGDLPDYGTKYLPALSPNGLYTVYALQHEGDTRGNRWVSDMTAVAISTDTPPMTAAYTDRWIDGT